MKLLLLLLISSAALISGEIEGLRSVVVVYRHGDRTPTEFAPNDVYKDRRYWSTEFGELTNKGKNQHYALGGWLRKRYSNYLPHIYSKNDIYVRSSNTDRCLMSAQSNLAGLYPPTSDQVWNGTLRWMPIPVHTVPEEEDNLLRMGKACPNFQPKYQELLSNDNFTTIDKDNADLYKYLTDNLGQEIKTFSDIEQPYDTMSIEDEYELRLPEWTQKVLPNGNKVFPDEMKKWADLSYETPTYTTELARLGTGRFFDTVASLFEAASKGETDKTIADKILMFSGHKSTVCDLTHTLGAFRLTPYAGALIFELIQNPKDKKFYVNTSFKDGDKLEALEIQGCAVNCDFEEFLNILKPYRLTEEEWETECSSSKSSTVLSSVSSIIMISFLSISLFA